MEPAEMTVKGGQPVTFVVTNTGAIDHEFYLGDEAGQTEQEQMMASGQMAHDTSESISLKPGETKQLTYTFAMAGQSLAGCHVAGGHSIDDPEPKYGMAVTGLVDPEQLLRNDSAQPGLPITLPKPLGAGVPNHRHQTTGRGFPEAVAGMPRRTRAPRRATSARPTRPAAPGKGVHTPAAVIALMVWLFRSAT